MKMENEFEPQLNLARRPSFAPSLPFSYTLIPNICAPDRAASSCQHQSEARGFGFSKGGKVLCSSFRKIKTQVQDVAILRKLRIWIAALAVVCLVAGMGIGAMLSGRTTVAQNQVQIARAPEALSASFAEIARRDETGGGKY